MLTDELHLMIKHLKILNLCLKKLRQVHYSYFKMSYINTVFRKVFSKTVIPTCFIKTSMMRIDTDMSSFTFKREGIVVVGVVARALWFEFCLDNPPPLWTRCNISLSGKGKAEGVDSSFKFIAAHSSFMRHMSMNISSKLLMSTDTSKYDKIYEKKGTLKCQITKVKF